MDRLADGWTMEQILGVLPSRDTRKRAGGKARTEVDTVVGKVI